MRWYQRLAHQILGWHYARVRAPFAEAVVRVVWTERGYLARPWADAVWLLLPSGAVAAPDNETDGWFWEPITFPPVSAEQHAAMEGRA